MFLNTFKGGTHPPTYKEYTRDKKIINLSVPDKVYIPMLQHIGLPANPSVKAGDSVKCGSIIGEPTGFISSYIHSSVSGTVDAIIDFDTIDGKKVKTVVINNDNKFEVDSDVLLPYQNWSGLSPQNIIEIVKKAGICGMGGATFPTYVKLNPGPSKKIDTLVLNGAECEPFLNADNRLMLEHPDEIIQGALILKKALYAEKIVIGIESNKPYAIENLIRESKKYNEISIIVLEIKYPQGAEKQLIEATLSRRVPPNGLPMDIGVVVQNVGTAKAVYDAVVNAKPLYERVVTVAGDAVSAPQNLRVRIGTTLFYLKDVVGLSIEKTNKIIFGGPMMGVAVDSLDYPVVKGTSGVLFFSNKYEYPSDYDVCIKCGKCVSGCPMKLLPNQLGLFFEKKKYDVLKDYNITDCMECGSCSFICPARRPLLQWIKAGKSEVKRLGH